MKRFRFAYKEFCIGFADVFADTEEEARTLFENGEYDPCINKMENEIAELIETDNVD